MEKYTHYLGPDSDPDTAGPQGVCVDFTTWGDGIYGEDWVPESYKSGRIVFTVPGNWSHTGCIAMTTPPPALGVRVGRRPRGRDRRRAGVRRGAGARSARSLGTRPSLSLLLFSAATTPTE